MIHVRHAAAAIASGLCETVQVFLPELRRLDDMAVTVEYCEFLGRQHHVADIEEPPGGRQVNLRCLVRLEDAVTSTR
jgi:hypothetical protein